MGGEGGPIDTSGNGLLLLGVLCVGDEGEWLRVRWRDRGRLGVVWVRWRDRGRLGVVCICVEGKMKQEAHGIKIGGEGMELGFEPGRKERIEDDL